MTDMVKADAEGLIWLVVGVFWVIAQIAGAAAQKKRTGQRPAGAAGTPSAPADPFAELLRKMAGGQRFDVPRPEEQELPEFLEAGLQEEEEEDSPWKRAAALRNEMLAKQNADLPEMMPLQRGPLSQGELYPAQVSVPTEIPEIDIRPKMSAFRASVPSMKLPLMSLRIDMPSFAESSAGRQGTGGRLDLLNRATLRRAMLHQIVFNPPKALEPLAR